MMTVRGSTREIPNQTYIFFQSACGLAICMRSCENMSLYYNGYGGKFACNNYKLKTKSISLECLLVSQAFYISGTEFFLFMSN